MFGFWWVFCVWTFFSQKILSAALDKRKFSLTRVYFKDKWMYNKLVLEFLVEEKHIENIHLTTVYQNTGSSGKTSRWFIISEFWFYIILIKLRRTELHRDSSTECIEIWNKCRMSILVNKYSPRHIYGSLYTSFKLWP